MYPGTGFTKQQVIDYYARIPGQYFLIWRDALDASAIPMGRTGSRFREKCPRCGRGVKTPDLGSAGGFAYVCESNIGLAINLAILV
jgi:hypothetical protein